MSPVAARHPRHSGRRLSLSFCLAAGLALPLAAQTATSSGAEPRLETEATKVEGSASLLVRVYGAEGEELRGSPGGADVSLDGRRLGFAPWTIPNLRPGSYLVGVSAPGFLPQSFTLEVVEKSAYTLSFQLERSRGGLLLRLSPADATLLVDGRVTPTAPSTLPSGAHTLEARAFGYTQARRSILVVAGAETRVDLSLEPVAFTIGTFAASRSLFSPKDAGGFGATQIGLRVSGPGRGRLTIIGPEGKEVLSRDLVFTTWETTLAWQGRDATGKPLGDGPYRVKVEARGEEGTEAAAELELRLDSTRTASPTGGLSGRPGLVYLPDPWGLPNGRGSLEVGIAGGEGALSGAADLGFHLALLKAIGPWTLGAFSGVAGDAGGTGTQGLLAGVSLAHPFTAPGRAWGVGILGRVAYLGAPDLELVGRWADLPDGLAAEVEVPGTVAIGPLHLGLAPGLRLGYTVDGSATLSLAPLVAAGAWLALPALKVGLSGILIQGDLAAALECRGLLPAAPFGAGLILEGRDLLTSPRLGLGLVLDLAF